MIVIGADTHKSNHMLVAVDQQTGALRGQLQIAASGAGALDALRFAAGLADERVWAIEDCRHVSARLEAALIAAGERVIRVPAAMTGQARKVSRRAGKSDPIDARAVALAVVRDGIGSFPQAFCDEHAMEIRVLCDYRDQIICERTRMINRLRWQLVTIAPELETQLAQAALKGPRVCARLARQLARLPQSPRLRVTKALLRRTSHDATTAARARGVECARREVLISCPMSRVPRADTCRIPPNAAAANRVRTPARVLKSRASRSVAERTDGGFSNCFPSLRFASRDRVGDISLARGARRRRVLCHGPDRQVV